MTLEERVTQLEKDAESRIAGEIWFQGKIEEWADNLTKLTSEKSNGAIRASMGNTNDIRKLLRDLQEHFKSHAYRKSKRYSKYSNE